MNAGGREKSNKKFEEVCYNIKDYEINEVG